MSDTNAVNEEGTLDLKFGPATVTVKALNIEASVQWTKRVKVQWFTQARKGLPVNGLQEVMSTPGPDIIQRIDTAIQGVMDAIGGGAVDDLLVVRDALMEHSPQILTAEVVSLGTAQQIVTAFEAVYELENPMKRLRNALARV
ncbi:MAG: hypothetical protein HZB26_07260 [Candidatus Hydrogenedentes bacterium]|nr:hypothetical protein [Candidatus Hydrogenedentota bacterium]